MRLPGRLAAAIEVLEDIDKRHRPVAEGLKAWGLNNPLPALVIALPSAI